MYRAAVLLVGIAPWLAAQDGATVAGAVTNSATHAPLGGVSVTLVRFGQPKQYNTTTDASGSYRITGVEAGEYQTQVHKTGFLDPPKAAPFESSLRVGAGATEIRQDFQLSPLAILRGRVFDPDGKPASHVEVGTSEFDTTETNTDGEYVLREVTPGSYTLFAKPKAAPGTVKDGKRSEVAITFFPGATDPAQAQPILVHGGDDLSGFDIHLGLSPVYRVRGIVLDSNGKPAAHADVSLRSRRGEGLLRGYTVFGNAGLAGVHSLSNVPYYLTGGNRLLQEADVETDDHGVFEFPSVRPGQWLLRTESEAARDGLTMSGATSLTVLDKDIDDFQLRFFSLFSLAVTVDWGDRPPPEGGQRPAVMLLSTDGGSIAFPTAVNAGRYKLVSMPGGPAGYYLAAAYLGNAAVLGQSIDLTPDSPPLRLVYKPNAGTITGTVEKGAGATVLLWPQASNAPDLIATAACDARGMFRFDSVPPGAYYVLPFDRVNSNGDSDAFLRSILPTAARVNVEEESTATVQTSVIHWPD